MRNDELLTPKEIAVILKRSIGRLSRDRYKGRACPLSVLGGAFATGGVTWNLG